MRTTLTLDDDVAAKLKEEARRSGRSFKEVVNSSLRLALTRPRRARREPFVVAARPLRARRRLSYDNVGELLEVAEGPDHRRGDATGPLAMDAALAALAVEHGAVLATTDRDFARFPTLRFENPLEP